MVLLCGVWEGNALIVGEVGTIVLALTALHSSRNLRNDVCRTFIGTSHVAQARRATFTCNSTLNSHYRGLQGMLQRIILVGIRAGAGGCHVFSELLD